MKLAMWLLWRFGVPQRNESLVGDLIEERAAGRSALWLWGQTAAAIADTVVRDLRDHWVLAIRAIGTGWIAFFLYGSICARVPLLEWWWETPNHTLQNLYFYILIAEVSIVWPLACGWTVARTHRAQPAAMVLAFAASVCLAYPWLWSRVWLGCFYPLGVLIGGLVQSPRRRTR